MYIFLFSWLFYGTSIYASLLQLYRSNVDSCTSAVMLTCFNCKVFLIKSFPCSKWHKMSVFYTEMFNMFCEPLYK